MSYGVTSFGEAITVELSAEQYQQIRAVQSKTNPKTGLAMASKHISQMFGYDAEHEDIATAEMFSPLAKLHPVLDPNKPLHEQVVDITRLAVYFTTCMCLVQTCANGCALKRDPEAMKVANRAVQLFTKGEGEDQRYFLEMQVQSTEQKPDSLYKAHQIFTRSSPFLDTGPYCGSNAKCKYSCTYASPKTFPLHELAKEHDPEGVLVSSFETLMRQVARMVEAGGRTIHAANFDAVKVQQPEMVAIIGGGPGGRQTAYDLAKRGYAVHLYEYQSQLGGATNTLIPNDKNDRSLSAEYTAEMQRMGVVLHMNTKVGDALTEAEISAGKTLITPDVLKQQYDAVVLATGVYNSHQSNGLGGIPGEQGKGVIEAHSFLEQANAYIHEMKQEAELSARYLPGFDAQTFIRDYMVVHPLKLQFGDETITLDDLRQREIFVQGQGYTGHDTMRMLMQLLAQGDAAQLADVSIHWQSRRMAQEDDVNWPDVLQNREAEPAVKMMRHLQTQGGKVQDEYLVAMKEIQRDDAGAITGIVFEERAVLNPTIARIKPGLAEYAVVDEFTLTPEKPPLVITATGFTQKKAHPLLQAFGVVAEGNEFPIQNYHAGFDEVYNVAIFAAGNLSMDKNIQADEVVNAIERGAFAAVHVDNFLTRSRGLNAAEKAQSYQQNAEFQLTSAQVFGKQKAATSTFGPSLTELLVSGQQRS